MYGFIVENPPRLPLSEYGPRAREFCEQVEPPVTFREALSVYRQLRWGSLIFRCTAVNT